MQSVTLGDNQQVSVSFQPEDADNQPAVNYQSGVWTPANPAICTVNVTSGNQLDANVVGVSPGVTTVEFTGQSAPAPASAPYSETFQVTVTGGPAAGGVFTFGTPTNQ